MFDTVTPDFHLDFSPFDATKAEKDSGASSCCGISLDAWIGTSHSTWDDTSYDTWSDIAAEFVGSTDVFPLNESATISVAGSQTTWASNPHYFAWQIIVLSTLAGLTSLVTVGGNLIVLLSFLIERTIRQPTNYFIASLACSDLLIGLISMPLYTVYLLTGARWPLGQVVCDLWLSVDYTACLCSIYTVFCITIDRFCSVSIPTKYRNWRTAPKIRMLVAMTWILPTLVFFTTIFGWQFFVGERTVPEGKCFVQYMENAVFNCALQVGYFWTTLIVMCSLYAGIYRVALALQRKSQAKMTKIASALTLDVDRTEKLRRSAVTVAPKLSTGTTELPVSSPDGQSTVKGLPGRITPPKSPPVLSVADNQATANGDHYSRSPGFLPDMEPSSHPAKTNSQRRNTTSVFLSPGSESTDRRVVSPSDATARCNRLLQPPPRLMPKRCLQRHPQSQQFDANVAEAYLRESNGDTSQPTRRERHSVQCLENDGRTERLGRCSKVEQVVGNRMNGHSQLHGKMTGETNINLDDVRYRNLSSANIAIAKEETLFEHRSNLPAMPASVETASFQASPVWKRRRETVSDLHCLSVDQKMAQMARDDYKRSSSVFTYTANDGFDDPVRSHTLAPSRFNCSRQTLDSGEAYNRHGLSVDYSISLMLDEYATPLDELARWHFEEDSQMPSISYQCTEITSTNRTDHRGSFRPTASERSKKTSCRRRNITRCGSVKTSQEVMGRKTENRAKKALRTITIILGAFVFCWTPWHVLSLIVGFCPDYGAALQILYDISYWLCYLNSPVNPFCYAFANQQFKKTFLRILKLDWHRT